MISKPRARCLKNNCKNSAVYGIQRPIHCEVHKNGNDINLVERICVKCGQLDVLNNENICVNFCMKDEENNVYKRRQKLKESRILKFLIETLGEPSNCDKMIDSVCGKEAKHRPDIVYDCKTHVVVNEIDEEQHKHNCSLGEQNRMRNIFFAYEGIPVIFVRYNPDHFRVNGQKIVIPIAKREDILLRWVKKAIQEEPKYHLSVIYLFYDGYKETVKEFHELDPYRCDVFTCNCGEEFYVPSIFEDHCKTCEKIKDSEVVRTTAL
jgi:hypothetical protein